MAEIPADILREAQASIGRMPERDAPMEAGEFWARVEYEVVSAILAAEERATQRERERWQPIETAPKDYTGVLLYDVNYNWGNRNVFEGYAAPNGDWFDVSGIPVSPTHWMPLPPPPL